MYNRVMIQQFNALEKAYFDDADPSAWFAACVQTLIARGEDVEAHWQVIAENSGTKRISGWTFPTDDIIALCTVLEHRARIGVTPTAKRPTTAAARRAYTKKPRPTK